MENKLLLLLTQYFMHSVGQMSDRPAEWKVKCNSEIHNYWCVMVCQVMLYSSLGTHLHTPAYASTW